MSLDCERAGESSSRVYWFLPFFLCDLFLSVLVGGGGGAGSTAEGVSGLGNEEGGGCAASATCGAGFGFSAGDGGCDTGSLGGGRTAVVRVVADRAAKGISSEGSESASSPVLVIQHCSHVLVSGGNRTVKPAPFRSSLSLVGSFHSLTLSLVSLAWLLRASGARRGCCASPRL